MGQSTHDPVSTRTAQTPIAQSEPVSALIAKVSVDARRSASILVDNLPRFEARKPFDSPERAAAFFLTPAETRLVERLLAGRALAKRRLRWASQ
jgi:hypothetical protein